MGDTTLVCHGGAQQFESGHKESFEGSRATGNIRLFGVIVATVVKDLGDIANEFQKSLVAPLLNLRLNQSQVHGIFDNLIIVRNILFLDRFAEWPRALVGLQLS